MKSLTNSFLSIEKRELPYLSVDAILPIPIQLASLPSDLIGLLVGLLEQSVQTKPETFLEALAMTSLSKCLMTLVRQMKSIELSPFPSLLHHLETMSMIVTSTPGEPVAPFISSVLVT